LREKTLRISYWVCDEEECIREMEGWYREEIKRRLGEV